MPKKNLKHLCIKNEYERRLLKVNQYHKKITKLVSEGKLREGDDRLYLILSYVNKINKINRILYRDDISLNHYIKNLNKN